MSRVGLKPIAVPDKVDITDEQGTTSDRTVLKVKVEEEATGELAFSAGFSSADAFLFSVQTIGSINYTVFVPQTVYANIIVSVEAFTMRRVAARTLRRCMWMRRFSSASPSASEMSSTCSFTRTSENRRSASRAYRCALRPMRPLPTQ